MNWLRQSVDWVWRFLILLVWRPRAVLFLTLALLAILIALEYLFGLRAGLRYWGSALQVAGLLLVLIQLFGAARSFQARPFSGVMEWLGELARHFQPKHQVVHAGVGGVILEGGDVVLGVGRAYDSSSLESRVTYLERTLVDLEQTLSKSTKEMKASIDAVRIDVQAIDAAARKKADEQQDAIRSLAVGNLDWSIAGVVLTMAGTVLAALELTASKLS